MKKYALLRYCLVFLAIVLPYFTAAAFHGTEMVLAERKPDMEEYLPILVFSQISPDMKKETIKAQTVIARSNIQRRIGEGKNLAEILWENRNTGEVWRYFFTEKNQIAVAVISIYSNGEIISQRKVNFISKAVDIVVDTINK